MELSISNQALIFGLIALLVVPVAISICLVLDRVRRAEALRGGDEWDKVADLPLQSSGVTVHVTEDGFQITTSTKNRIAYFSVPFVFVWSVIAISFFYGSQILRGQFSLVLSIIGLPFVLLGMRLWWDALISVYGRIHISVANNHGEVFVGLGSWGATKRFRWEEVTGVYESRKHWTDPRGWRVGIVIDSQRPLKFGWHPLTETRRRIIIKVLQGMRRPAPPCGDRSTVPGSPSAPKTRLA